MFPKLKSFYFPEVFKTGQKKAAGEVMEGLKLMPE